MIDYLIKIKNVLVSIFGLALFVLGGWLFYKKQQTNEVLKENDQVKDEIKVIDQTIDANKVTLDSEAQKRAELEKEAKDKENAATTKDDLLKFLNTPKQ